MRRTRIGPGVVDRGSVWKGAGLRDEPPQARQLRVGNARVDVVGTQVTDVIGEPLYSRGVAGTDLPLQLVPLLGSDGLKWPHLEA